jgi:acyl-CoA thioester hydrolase
LIKADGNTVAFEAIFKCVMLNLETRRAAVVPEEVRQKAVQWIEA